MSMPTFPKSSDILSREEAINAVISSIAMEEAALSHILNAEGEKIQYVIEKEKNSETPDLKMILAVNKSVESLVEHINDAQIILKNKLNLAVSILPHNDYQISENPHHHQPHQEKPTPPNPPPVTPPCPEPPPVTPPCPEPPPPKPPCPKPPPEKPHCLCEGHSHSCVFAVPCGHNWAGESTLCFEERKCFSSCSGTYSGIKTCREHHETYILLPGSTSYEVGLELVLANQSAYPVTIEVSLVCNSGKVFHKTYSFEAQTQSIHIGDKIDIPFQYLTGKFSLRLLSSKSILVKSGGVSVRITGRY